MHELVVISGPDRGRTFRLDEGQTLVIGRGQASDTKINDPSMSRIHCRAMVDGGSVSVVDAGSSSGIVSNGAKVESVTLQPGDVIQLGDTKLRYQLESAVEATTLGGNQLFGKPKPKPDVAPLHELVGESFHSYRLDHIISSGNSGMVFKATDTEKERVVAVKVLTPDVTGSDEQKERFVRAMKTMMPIRHPNIVRIYNAGKKGPYCWAAMEYVEGESLADVIDKIGVQGMLDWRDVWRVAMHIGGALQEADEHQIIHRNVTPTNLLRRDRDKVCLLGDLMLAKALQGALAKQVTQPGQLVGDVPYMSPERTRVDAEVDGRADMYGLGATCYALLTGRPPFQSDSLPELIRMVRQDEPRKPKEVQMSINEMFQDVVLKMLAKDPADRFDSPSTLLRDLERIGKFNGLSEE